MGTQLNPPELFRRHLCFLDVGHGNCAVLIAGNEDVIVIDVGRQSALSEFLQQQEITHIQSIYLSHADADHMGALVGIIATQQVTIGQIFLNSDSSKNSKVWDDLLYELDADQTAHPITLNIRLVAGMKESLRCNVEIEVLGPSNYLAAKGPGATHRSGGQITSNTISAVIAIEVKGERLALLPGDLDKVGLTDLLRSSQALDAPILVYPHHGGLPGRSDPVAFCETLVSKVAPDCVIFSIGRSQYNTPRPETMRALRKRLPDARIVCTQLSKHCSETRPSKSPTHLSGTFAAGLARRSCCGGTIVVPLDDPDRISPAQEQHTEFIHVHANTALCKERSLPKEQVALAR